RMLPKVVWDMPPMGTFNLHGSLLPKYRGAAPINWAIINGEQETGLTTFFLKQEIDTGDMLLQSSTPIGPNDTAGDLHDRMMHIGADLVLATVRLLEDGDYRLQQQNDELACPAPKLFRDNCRIDFSQSAQTVHNFIRGLSPYPTAWTLLGDDTLKIIRATLDQSTHDLVPGTIVIESKKAFKIACGKGFVYPTELQLSGRKRMDVVSFLNGVDLPAEELIS
ncbi:MAG: methionyl-tRNA formyltransferase, partial [Bacteroidota bacterium]